MRKGHGPLTRDEHSTSRLLGNQRRDVHFRPSPSTGPSVAPGSHDAPAHAVVHNPIRQVLMRRSLAASVASATAAIAFSSGCIIVDPSCSSGGAAIFVSPSTVVVAVGATATPRASWCRGGRYDRLSPQWSLGSAADANIISVDAETGRITGRRVGYATVIATYEGMEGSSVSVTVE